MLNLGSLVETLGPQAMVFVAGRNRADITVTGIAIHDRLEHVPARRGDLVLGVGIDQEEATRLLPLLADSRAAGLVLKLSRRPTDELITTADQLSFSVMSVVPGADWAQVANLLRTALAQEGFGTPDEAVGGVAAGDLFAVANAVAAMVDAPVTIDDPQSRVLAYSLRQDEADEPRRDTIIGRQVPKPYMDRLTESGIFNRLRRESGIVLFEDAQLGVKPRAAIGIKAGDEFLGSIWAAYKPPLRAEQESALIEVAKFVAVHLLRHRIGADVQRGLQTSLVAAVLEGTRSAGEAAIRLGLPGDTCRVLAIGLKKGGDDQEAHLMRHWDLLSLHLSASHRRSTTALIGGAVYAILPTDKNSARGLASVQNAAETYLKRTASWRENVMIGIGGEASGINAIPGSRRDADQVLRVLRTAGAERLVAEIDDVRVHALLLELADMHPGGPSMGGKLGRLIEYDRKHKTGYLQTLRAYLDAFGNTVVAASALQIHPNTFRYRLRKLQEVSGIRLSDQDERVGLLLQIRLLKPTENREERQNN